MPGSTLLILDIDFQKAFDSISHEFLRILLPLFSFGVRSCSFLLAIVTSMTTQIMINDDVTDRIRISKGIAQGSSLSAILFILAIEPMLRLARKNEHIMSGVQLGQSLHLKDNELLPSITDLIYADDVNHAPCKSLDALKGWINTLDQFNKISGLKRNNEKTRIRMVGSAFLTLANDNLCLSILGEETKKLIKECPLAPKHPYSRLHSPQTLKLVVFFTLSPTFSKTQTFPPLPFLTNHGQAEPVELAVDSKIWTASMKP